MSDFQAGVGNVLDCYVPLRLDRRPVWDEVIARSGAGSSPAEPRFRFGGRWTRRLVLGLALFVLVLALGSAVAAAFGRSPFGQLSSWLGRSPGVPAPAAEQAGFEKRNGASYASFPRNTRLRLIAQATVAGRSFSLLGFRNGGSFCLRVVPSAAPALRGVNQCVTLRELQRSPAPALVASTAYFTIKGGGRAEAVFGFADNTVRSVGIVRSLAGQQRVAVANDVFLAVHAAPENPIYDPIVQVSAQTVNRRSFVLPFTTLGAAPLLAVPSYLRRTHVVLPGPKTVEARLPQAGIAWLDKREPRGQAFSPSVLSFGLKSAHVPFSRSVEPDPGDAYRIAFSFIRIGTIPAPDRVAWGPVPGKSIALHPGMLLLCYAELFPLRPPPRLYPCSSAARSSALFSSGHVLTVSRVYREAFTRVSGLAADGVREVDLYLAGGRVVPAALRYNVYTVEAPSSQWPAKLVAFNNAGRAVEVDLIDKQASQSVVTPCPVARVSTEALPATTRRYERLDLANGDVNGRPVLGQNKTDVEGDLGRPDARRGSDLLYGLLPGGDAALRIHFAARRDLTRAVWLEVRDPDAIDRRIGHLLRLQPTVVQQRIATAYPTYLHLFAYGSQPALLGCSGTLRNRRGNLEIQFGLDPNRPSQLYLRLSDPRVEQGSTP